MNSILAGLVALAALIGAALLYGQHEHSQGVTEGKAAVQQRWDEARAVEQAAAAAAASANLKETERRIAAQEEIAHVADQAASKARADADGAAAASTRLRQQLAAYVAASRRVSKDPGLATPGPAASAPVVVLADVFSRADQAAGELAAAIDLTHAAGGACQREYRSLAPK